MNDMAGTGDDLRREGHAIPLYAQLAQLLRQRIYAGQFKRGDTLPSEQALRAEYRVSFTVVRSALDLLRREGLIVTEHGVGSTVQTVPARITVQAGPGDSTESRLPTPAERDALDLPVGVPVLVLRHANGREELYSALRTRITFGDG
jgi:DNA-binding transcriptional MocR family regulator